MEREDAINLLTDQHTFPGEFVFRAIVPPHQRQAIVDATQGALDTGSHLVEVVERPSRTGKWLSVHLRVHADSAEQVLAVYAALQAVDGVAMTL